MMLQGRVALVTGASRGLGAGVAERFLREGADVILLSRSRDTLDVVAARLSALCGPDHRVLAVLGDISSPRSIARAFLGIQREFGSIDVVVNNAGVFVPMGDFEKVEWSEWVQAIATNVAGTAYMCRKAIPMLRQSARGKIINVAGGGATRPLPPLSAYGTSKAAILRLTEELAAYLAPDGIDVNSIAPGPLDTRFVDEAIAAGPGNLGGALYREILDIRATGGTPMAVSADLCAFLASRRSDGITGRFISARYDDWESFRDWSDAREKSDLYRMRRLDPDTLTRVKRLL